MYWNPPPPLPANHFSECMHNSIFAAILRMLVLIQNMKQSEHRRAHIARAEKRLLNMSSRRVRQIDEREMLRQVEAHQTGRTSGRGEFRTSLQRGGQATKMRFFALIELNSRSQIIFPSWSHP